MTSRWLRLIRIHTSSLTQAAVLLGLVLAGKNMGWSWFLFAFFAVLFHATGFLHNDLCDYKHDKEDHAKKHFPLVTGEVSLRQATHVCFILTAIGLVFGGFLSRGKILSIFPLGTAIAFGYIYNSRSKKDVVSPLYITLSFTSLPLFSYFAHTDHLSFTMILVVLYMAFTMLYQIAVEGYIKDIGSDKVSLLKNLGTRSREGGSILVNAKTKLFAWSLKVPLFFLFGIIANHVHSDPAVFFAGTLLAIGILVSSVKLLESGHFDNRKRVRLCAIIEVLTYTLLVVSLQGALGWSGLAFFILYPYTWFVVLNRLTWKTWITPRV